MMFGKIINAQTDFFKCRVPNWIIYPFKTVLFLTYTPHGFEIQKCVWKKKKEKKKNRTKRAFQWSVHSLTTTMPFLLFHFVQICKVGDETSNVMSRFRIKGQTDTEDHMARLQLSNRLKICLERKERKSFNKRQSCLTNSTIVKFIQASHRLYELIVTRHIQE